VQGELVCLGHRIAASIGWQIPPVTPASTPHRASQAPWRQFLTTQAKTVLAVDFVHGNTVVLRGISALIAVEHSSRRAHLLGATAHPTGAWTIHAARTLMRDAL
jgi:putative transposase